MNGRDGTAGLEASLRYTVGGFTLFCDFRLERGLTVLFGPSGAGKSLTLGALAGLVRPHAGRITLDGAVLADAEAGVHVPPRARHAGVVFQDALLLPHRSVVDNVALAVREVPARRERRATARAWLERVGAGDLDAARPPALSGGQRQRVALARALAGRPRMLLLDEPFSALDLPVRRRLRSLVRELVAGEDVVTLFVTHDPDEAAELADTLLVADGGRVEETVTGSHIRERLAVATDARSGIDGKVTGLVLAGGKGERMGRDKATITLDGERLVDRCVRIVSELAAETFVASGDGRRIPDLACEQIPDAEPDAGPVAGILAGLERARTPLVCVVACDLPGASPAVLARLTELWRGEACVVPEIDGRLEPLHAVFARAAAPAIRAYLASGERSVTEVVRRLGPRVVRADELPPDTRSGAFARNVNRPEDLERMLRDEG